MATLEEVYDKLLSDEGEKKALAQAFAGAREGVAAFLADRGCDAEPEEFVTLLRGKSSESTGVELDDKELEATAAGFDWKLCLESVASFGIWCALVMS